MSKAATPSPPPASDTAPTSSLLSYPTFDSEPSTSSAAQPQPRHREILRERLYVGNLHPSITEHSLIQVFSKFGKLSNLDFLFHKTGALKGKPRGYAFIEYTNADDATKALAAAHGKLVHGRKLVVTHAHQAPLDQGGGYVPRRAVNEAGRPTTLSLIKSSSSHKPRDAIAALEAKLKQLERSSEPPDPSASTSSLTHPLPAKPAFSSSSSLPTSPYPKRSPQAQVPSVPPPPQPRAKPTIAPSSVPFRQQAPKPAELVLSFGGGSAGAPKKKAASSLKGVKLVKKKDKAEGASAAAAAEGAGSTES